MPMGIQEQGILFYSQTMPFYNTLTIVGMLAWLAASLQATVRPCGKVFLRKYFTTYATLLVGAGLEHRFRLSGISLGIVQVHAILAVRGRSVCRGPLVKLGQLLVDFTT